ncbi:sulfotransferase family protein [Tautonia marina]|uniref:sulfotransferase family protein n=1 Tax=Tautonia marina TaxID=2653855 RepID=UPI001260C69F|nr:sulfotransferase family protein [Tautonia marina]
MSYSHNLKFVFIHIPKCAGTSIEKALQGQCKIENIGKFDQDFIEKNKLGLSSRFHLSGKHLAASDLRKLMGEEIFDSYFSFAFVRNPFSRLVSYYHFLKRHDSLEHEKAQVRLALHANTFTDFVKAALNDADPASDLLFNQQPYICNEEGKIIVDKIYKFENLQHDFADACRRIGVRPGLASHIRDLFHVPRITLPRLNRGDGKTAQYQNYYDSGIRRAVEDRCQQDLVTFNYSFDDYARTPQPVPVTSSADSSY